MALTLAIYLEQTESCANLVITDDSGEYHADSNPTGWQTSSSGGSNLQIDNSSITEAYLKLTTPDSRVIQIDLMDVDTWQAITPYTSGDPFDSSVTPDGLSYTITEEVLGVSLVDGVWKLEYYVTNIPEGVPVPIGAASATYTSYIALYCRIECCISQLVERIPDYYSCDDCSNKNVLDILTAQAMLEALRGSAYLATLDRFSTILSTLEDICDTLDCS